MHKIEKRLKGKSVSMEQKNIIIDFMEGHPELQKGKFGPNFTHKQASLLWNQLAIELNSVIGANKNADKWRKCWIDMKSNVKARNVHLKKSRTKTGGGEETKLLHLDPLEDRISDMIGEVSIFGQTQTDEPTVSFEGYYNYAVMDSKNITDQPIEDITSISDEIEIEDVAIQLDYPNKTDTNDEHRQKEKLGKIGCATKIRPPIKKMSKHVLQRSSEMSSDLIYLSEERNSILKEYYAKNLLLLEIMVIAKEEKVSLMRAASSKET